MATAPLLRVLRGGVVESLHRGSFVAVEAGRVVMSRGDPSGATYFRSTSKPLQAIAGVTSGAVDAFGIEAAELALATGSHAARPEHLAAARSILAKAGVPEDALGCGGHASSDPEVLCRQRAERDAPLRIWSNCSGKHALMLAAARRMDAPLASYLDPSHPLQRTILAHVAAFCAMAPEEVRVGTDGCSAPNFAVPLERMARALARLGAPEDLPEDLADAARRIAGAMHAHPEMIAGPGRFDTDLMRTARTPLLAKAGAEGVHGVAVPSRRLGLAIKVEDGGDRGYRLLVIALLLRLGVLTAEEAEGLRQRHADPVLRNWAGLAVGHLEACLDD